MVHPQRTSDEKRPGRGRQRINPREFATTGPRTPETAANYLLHGGLRQDGGGDQRGVSFNIPFENPLWTMPIAQQKMGLLQGVGTAAFQSKAIGMAVGLRFRDGIKTQQI